MESSQLVEEQQIKKSLAPAQWDCLKKEVEELCDSLNEVSRFERRFEARAFLEAIVRNMQTGAISHMRYDPSVPCIHYETPQQKGHIGFRVSPDGARIQFMDEGTPRMAKELAMILVGSVR